MFAQRDPFNLAIRHGQQRTATRTAWTTPNPSARLAALALGSRCSASSSGSGSLSAGRARCWASTAPLSAGPRRPPMTLRPACVSICGTSLATIRDMSDDSERHPMRVLLLVLLVALVGVLAYGVVHFDWLQRPDSAVETVAVWTEPPLEEEAALDVDEPSATSSVATTTIPETPEDAVATIEAQEPAETEAESVETVSADNQ